MGWEVELRSARIGAWAWSWLGGGLVRCSQLLNGAGWGAITPSLRALLVIRHRKHDRTGTRSRAIRGTRTMEEA